MTKQIIERILQLDTYPVIPKIKGVKLDTLWEDDLGKTEVHPNTSRGFEDIRLEIVPSVGLLRKIESVTKNREVDFVCIGHNHGKGLKRAVYVAEEMRANKVCILFRDGSHQDLEEIETDVYAKLGFKHFMEEEDFPEFFKKYIKAKYKK